MGWSNRLLSLSCLAIAFACSEPARSPPLSADKHADAPHGADPANDDPSDDSPDPEDDPGDDDSDDPSGDSSEDPQADARTPWSPSSACNEWGAVPSMSVRRGYHTATVLDDGRVLVAGGWGSDAPYASVELYDPRTNTWRLGPDMTVRRLRQTATKLRDGRVLMAGGIRWEDHDVKGTQQVMRSAEIFNPVTGTWTPAAPMHDARHWHGAVLLQDGRVLVFGGDPNPPAGRLTSAEIYDPDTDTWTRAGNLSEPRFAMPSALLPSGKVLVAAGNHGQVTELFDPETLSWSQGPQLRSGHFSGSIGAYADGVLVMGGGDRSTEFWKEGTSEWAPGPTLDTAHLEGAALNLRDGRLVVVGGREGTEEMYPTHTSVMPGTSELTRAPLQSWFGFGHQTVLLGDGSLLVTGAYSVRAERMTPCPD